MIYTAVLVVLGLICGAFYALWLHHETQKAERLQREIDYVVNMQHRGEIDE